MMHVAHVLRMLGRTLDPNTDFSALEVTNSFPLQADVLPFPESGMSELDYGEGALF